MHFLIFFCAILASSSGTLPVKHEKKGPQVALGINSNLNSTQRTLSLGANSFLDLVANGVFVDKTLILHELFQSVIWFSIIVSPQKWGKTVNLHMMKTFLEMKVHPNGTRMLPITATENYKLFVEGRYHSNDYDIKLEKPPLIGNVEYRSTVDRYLGQYIVIFMSFSGVASNHEKNFTTILSEIMAKTYDDHKYMLNLYDEVLQDPYTDKHLKIRAKHNKKKFLTYLNGERGEKIDFEKGIDFLTQELFEYFDESKVCILIDDYDQLFRWDAPTMILPDVFEVKIIGGQWVKKAILTGVCPKMFQRTEMIVNRFLQAPHPFYGFTDEEMDLIYNFYEIPAAERDKIKYWYGGHEVVKGNITKEVFTPWSVCNYIQSRQLKPYWVDADFDDITLEDIFELSRFKFVFSHIITGKSYDEEYKRFSDKEWFHLNATNDIKQALLYLYYTGYLTKTNIRLVSTDTYSYRIPNYEISVGLRDIIATRIQKQFDRHLREHLQKTSTTWQAFLLGDELTSQELETSINTCYKFMLRYSKKDQYHAAGGVEALVRTIVALSLATNELHFVNSLFVQIPTDTSQQPKIVLTSKNRGFIIDVKLGENKASIENRTSCYMEMFKPYPALHSWKDIKLVFFDLMLNESVNIFSILYSKGLEKS